MKYNTTKSYQHSEDEPNININSNSSPVDEKRLLLKKSYIKQNRKEKRIEKNTCNILSNTQFKKKWEHGPLRPAIHMKDEHIIPGLLSGFDPGYKEISSEGQLMIVNTPAHLLDLEESSATSVGAWAGYEHYQKNAPEGSHADIVQYVKSHPLNSFTRDLGGHRYEFKIKQLFSLQENRVLGFTLITGKWKGMGGGHWGFIKWFDGNWQCQVSELYAFKLGNEDITQRHLFNIHRELRPTTQVLEQYGIVDPEGGSGSGLGLGQCPFFANEREFLDMYSPVVDVNFFTSYGRVPGILSGYSPSPVGISKQFPPKEYFFNNSSSTLSAAQWTRNEGDDGLTKQQFIQQNPILFNWNWSPHSNPNKKFNIKLAQMYSPKPASTMNNVDILGFKIQAGVSKDEPNQEYGFIQWYRGSFDCPVSDVYKFKIGHNDDSDVYLNMLPKAYRGADAIDDVTPESIYPESEAEYDENEDIEVEGASTLGSAGEGIGRANAAGECPRHCTNPHSDGWWRNTNELLWKNSAHKKEVGQRLKQMMYPSLSNGEIIEITTRTYDIELAHKFDKNRLKERRLTDAAIHCVRNAYEELSQEINGKLKLSSKNMVREVWLRKLMKYITNEFLRYHFEPVLEKGEKELQNVWPNISDLPYEVQKKAVDAVLNNAIDKADIIFGLLSDHLNELNAIWRAGDYGSEPLYLPGILEPFLKSSLNKYKTDMLKRYGLDADVLKRGAGDGPTGKGVGEGVSELGSASSGVGPPSGPFGGMTFKEEEMLFFKRNAKKIMVAIIKDTPFPTDVLDELEAQAGEGAPSREVVTQEFNVKVNQLLIDTAGDNAPVIDINTSKMSELFHAFSIIDQDNITQMNQVMAYLAINMAGEEEWIIEQFKEIQKSRYKDTKIVKFAVQFIKKLANTIETEQKIEQKIELDVEQVEKIGEAINETETPSEELEKDLDVARDEVRQECENKTDGLKAQIEELREELQKEKDKIKGKDNMIKYGAIGAGVVIVLLILFLLIK